ncbi:hypothetical protein LTR67_006297 [Exophiala xenobiotica]
MSEASEPFAPPKGPANGTANFTDDSAWAKKFLLSFDGGGIRGLSSLFILKELMVQIQKIEMEADPNHATHSFYPLEERAPIVNAKPIANEKRKKSLSFPLSPRISPSDKQPERNGPEYKYLPCHYFDFIVGTSTGGLIAMMLGRLRMSVGHCIEEYITLGAEVFGKPRTFCARSPLYWNRGKYHSGNVEKVVQHVSEKYTPSVQMEGCDRITFDCPETICKTWVPQKISHPWTEAYVFSMVFATQETELKPYIFRSYDHQLKTTSASHCNPGVANTDPLYVVGRATSAAPGYFNPLPINEKIFLDGGLVANNPTHYAYHEVRLLQIERPPKFVLSIGTGKKNKRSFKRLKRFFPHWAPFISLELNNKIAESESAHDQMLQHLDQMREQLDQPPTWKPFEYARLNVTTDFGLGWMKLDEWKRKASSKPRAPDVQPTAQEFVRHREYSREKRSKHHDTVEFIEIRTERYLKQEDVQSQVRKLAGALVENRRQRSKTWKWEHFATGDRWQCPIRRDDGCNGDRFDTQKELERHLSERHPERPHRATRECVIPY